MLQIKITFRLKFFNPGESPFTLSPRLQNSRVFFAKSVKKSVKRAVRVLRTRSAQASHSRNVSPQVSLSVFNLVPDLLFDFSRVLEYAKIRIVLQSICLLSLIIHEIPCEFGEVQCIILQFNFILDSKFIFLCVKLIIIHKHTQKQSKLK